MATSTWASKPVVARPFVDDVRLYRLLLERSISTRTPTCRAHGGDREHAGRVVQLLGHILAHAAHGLAAALSHLGLV